jgi:pSer/pThr/pTyr-binding forkhead associated (FHA) protein
MAGTPKVIILSEQLRGQSFELAKEEHTIGRTEDCDICVPDPTISSHHCTLIRLDDGTYAARDEGSTNGTRVNGVRLENDTQALVNSDILQVGSVEMLFDCEGTRSDGASTTQTVINLDETQTGELPVSEMANLGGDFRRRQTGIQRDGGKGIVLIWVVLGVLIVAVIAMSVLLIMQMTGG